jgi:hypothetical protein
MHTLGLFWVAALTIGAAPELPDLGTRETGGPIPDGQWQVIWEAGGDGKLATERVKTRRGLFIEFEWKRRNQPGRITIGASYRIRPSTSPPQVDVVLLGRTKFRGIYQSKRDCLYLFLAREGERPESFSRRPDNRRWLLILQRSDR